MVDDGSQAPVTLCLSLSMKWESIMSIINVFEMYGLRIPQILVGTDCAVNETGSWALLSLSTVSESPGAVATDSPPA